ncbi:DUF6230 family protein [Streptomyces sp. NPDC002033]|uniref:DUF6230 family protein n=1 Tax=unclassified Streptomyces TaxID=2593676 RepID=UPI0033187474
MSSQVRGGTRWKRFALVMVPSIAATAAVGVGLAQGALAASFSVSGQDFKVSADKLDGDDLLQYGSVAKGKTADGKGEAQHPVTISGFRHAEITNMCQSLVTPIPGIGAITMQLRTGNKGTPAVAENIYLDVAELDTDAKFTDLDIGVAVADAADKDHPTAPQANTVASGGLFSQRAKKAVLTNVRQKAWATTAGTFTLPNLKLRLLSGDEPCYKDEK